MQFRRVPFVVFVVSVVYLSVNLVGQVNPDKLPARTPGLPSPNPSAPGSPAPFSIPKMPPVPLETARFKLLTSTTGWAATDRMLLWTTDGGAHWKDITPSNPHHSQRDRQHDDLASIFFLDANTGWVLFSYQSGPESDDWAFDVSSTVDAGESWSTTHVTAADVDQEALSGSGDIAFADSLHGWVNLALKSSAAFNSGDVLSTLDGGRTWKALKNGPGLSGPILLLPNGNGWLVGQDDSELYATHDGGSSFQEVSLPAPEEIAPAGRPAYDLPIFEDNLHGHVAVTYSGNSQAAAVLFATEDGGLTWKADGILTNVDGASIGQMVTSTVADSTWIIPVTLKRSQPTLIQIPHGGRVVADGKTGKLGNTTISFFSPTRGWVWLTGLLSTTDGGATWRTITPMASNGVVTQGSTFPPGQTGSASVRPALCPRQEGSSMRPNRLFTPATVLRPSHKG
jgi:photosystem II stability/assembly factor-like uncharacterized protein